MLNNKTIDCRGERRVRDKTDFDIGYIIKYRGGKTMTVQAMNKTKIVKKRKLKVRRFQSDRVQKVKV